MNDRVVFVADDELPEGHDWCYVVAEDGRDYFFIRQSRVTPQVLSQAWSMLGAGRSSDAVA